MAKHHYLEVDPSSHTHSAGEIVGHDGQDLVGPPGRDGKDGVDGKDGRPGRDSTVPGPEGPRGDGKDGVDGRDGKDGSNGVDGKDAVLPEGLVTIERPSGTLFGTPDVDTVYRLVSGVASVNFSAGHGAFALPKGTKGIASFHATLVGRLLGVGVVAPTDASAIGLLSDAIGSQQVAYLALIW